MFVITQHDIASLADGAAVLGSGGGGDVELFKRIVRLDEAYPVFDAVDIPPDVFVIPVGVVGSTEMFLERPFSGKEFDNALRSLSPHGGREFDTAYIMSIESAGMNVFVALSTAIDHGRPLVDADFMGRALPRLDQLSAAVAGRSLTPCAIADPDGSVTIIHEATAENVERKVRAILGSSGGWGMILFPPVRAADLPEVAATGTLRRAIAIGRRLARHQIEAHGADTNLEDGGWQSTACEVREVTHTRVAGQMFARGHVTMLSARDDTVFRLEMQNEFVALFSNGELIATTPMIISLLSFDSGNVIHTDEVRTGQAVIISVLNAPPWWVAHPSRLDAVGPRGFGIDLDTVVTVEAG